MVELGLTLVLLTIGYFFGSAREKQHFAELRRREALLLERVPTRSDFGPPCGGETFLVYGSVVVGSDYFKDFVAALRNFFGGRLTSYESLLDRARREAMCRMRERALDAGASAVVGVRIETSRIAGMGVEVLTYGTAVRA